MYAYEIRNDLSQKLKSLLYFGLTPASRSATTEYGNTCLYQDGVYKHVRFHTRATKQKHTRDSALTLHNSMTYKIVEKYLKLHIKYEYPCCVTDRNIQAVQDARNQIMFDDLA